MSKKIIVLLFFLISPALLFAEYTFSWDLDQDERLEIIKTANVSYLVNNKVNKQYLERNIIDLTCTDINDKGLHVAGTFSLFDREKSEEVFKKYDEFKTDFILERTGRFIISGKQVMPNLRHIPSFPAKAVSPGDTWEADAQMLFNNFSQPFMITMPVKYQYIKDTEISGKKLAIVAYTFSIDNLIPENFPNDFPAKIVGEDRGTIFWDMENNVPQNIVSKYHMGFVYVTGPKTVITEQYIMDLDAKHTVYKPVPKKEIQKDEEDFKEKLLKEKGVSIEENEKGLVVRLGEVLFDFDSYEIRPETQTTIENIVKVIKEKYPDREIIVEGHTDDTGNSAYNQQLSQKRADGVSSIIKDKVGHDKVSYQGFGEKHPIESNATKEGRKKNRRVDIIIKLK